MDKKTFWDAFTYGFTDKQLAATVTLLWRLLVTFHIAWVCGFLISFGFNPPFVAAETMKEVDIKVQKLTAAIKLTTKLALLREIRIQKTLLCTLTDPKLIEGVRYTLDRLREDYRELTGQAVMLEGCEG